MSATVLSVATRAVLTACERIGLDGRGLLLAARLERADIDDPDRRIPAEKADLLWQAAFASLAHPTLALEAALALPEASYPVLHYIGAHAPTLGAALERVVRYFPLADPRVEWRIAAGPGGAMALVMSVPGLATGVPRPPAEYTLTAIVHQTRAATKLDWWPSAVDFEHDAPPEIAAAQRRALGAPCRHGQDRTALVIAADAWQRPVPRSDPALLALLEQHAAQLVATVPHEAGLVARLRAALGERLRAGLGVDVDGVARAVGLGARTLQRRLEAERTRYAAIVDEVRAETARALLADPNVALSEIAFLLGFSDQSAFTRAFRRWTGEPPSSARGRTARQRDGFSPRS